MHFCQAAHWTSSQEGGRTWLKSERKEEHTASHHNCSTDDDPNRSIYGSRSSLCSGVSQEGKVRERSAHGGC